MPTPTVEDLIVCPFLRLYTSGLVQILCGRSESPIPWWEENHQRHLKGGVAIATALMPPLCTAGYGIATGQFHYFAGAFYLFIINTVFIAIASFIKVGLLKYKRKVILDPVREKRSNISFFILTILIVVPCGFIGSNLVRKSFV